jgi:hypothetical protein
MSDRCAMKLWRGPGPWRRLQVGNQRRSGNLRHSASLRPLVAAVTGLWLMCTAVFALGYAVGDWETMLVPV